MGVKCSLLGHDYGDADVERERAEDGDEVVRTARRVERCRNCGHERTVSENTEVTSLEAAAGVVREPDGTVVAAAEGDFETASEADGGITIDEVTEDTDENESPSPAPAAEPGDGEREQIARIETGSTVDEVRHAGPKRAPGEWPTEPGESISTSASRNDQGGLDSTGSLASVEASTTSWPSESDTSASTAAKTVGDRPDRDRLSGASLECSSCGFSAVAAESSLRAGDICPGCQHGYLAFETRNR